MGPAVSRLYAATGTHEADDYHIAGVARYMQLEVRSQVYRVRNRLLCWECAAFHHLCNDCAQLRALIMSTGSTRIADFALE